MIDEVHNLVERGRGYYSPELSARQARAAAESLHGGSALDRGGRRRARTLIEARAARACAASRQTLIERHAVASCAPGRSPSEPRARAAAEAPLPEEELWRLRPRLRRRLRRLPRVAAREPRSFRADDPFVGALLRRCCASSTCCWSLDGAFSTLRGRAPAATASCRSCARTPAASSARSINRTHSTIGLSATLSPPEFYRDLLGFERGRTASLSLPDPFPAEQPPRRRRRHRRDHLEASARPTTRASPSASAPSPTRCPATAWRSSPATTSCAAVAERLQRARASASSSSSAPTATATARRCSPPCAARCSATCCCWRWPAASSPRASTTRATCCRRWRWSAPACPR